MGDWTTIQTCLAQAGIPASLTTSQRTKLTANDAAQGDYFGWSVAISGNTVMVGVLYDDDGGGESGSTYVFRGLKPSLVERRCPCCGAESSVKKAVYRCPNCGGDLRLERE